MNVVIGCGGGGSITAPLLRKLVGDLLLVDGDRFEEKNLDRQFFKAEDVGMNKAHALGILLDCESDDRWFHAGLLRLAPMDVLFVCVDNNAARLQALLACDQYGCKAIFQANEYTEAEAYFYERGMKDTPNDPRVFYPDILTDRSGDPLGPPGCVEAARERPQLVLANAWSSSLALSLFWFHTKERQKLEPEFEPYWPIHHLCNERGWWTIKKGDRLES